MLATDNATYPTKSCLSNNMPKQRRTIKSQRTVLCGIATHKCYLPLGCADYTCKTSAIRASLPSQAASCRQNSQSTAFACHGGDLSGQQYITCCWCCCCNHMSSQRQQQPLLKYQRKTYVYSGGLSAPGRSVGCIVVILATLSKPLKSENLHSSASHSLLSSASACSAPAFWPTIVFSCRTVL